MAKIWGIQPWAGKVIDGSDTRTVMDQYNAEAKPEDKAKAQAESQALEGTSFILDDYIGPGAFAKVGATLKAAAGALAGKAMLVGAFRNSNDSMLARGLVEQASSKIANKQRWLMEDLANERIYNPDEARLLHTIRGKLTDREISKYGTPEFTVDKWLDTTQNIPGVIPSNMNPITREDILETAKPIATWNSVKAGVITEGKGMDPIELEKIIALSDRKILNHDTLPMVEDFNLASKQGKTLYGTSDPWLVSEDIDSAFLKMLDKLQDYGITAPNVEGKSLQQIASIIHKKDEESVRILRKSMDAKNKIIQAKTVQLAQSSPQPVEGFVQLMEPIDLAHETASLNHCLGAVGRDNDVYTPAFDVITGKAHPNQASTNTSYAGYVERMADGRSEFYSYRPKGTPEFTIEVVNNGKGRYITQAYGKEDRVLTDAEENLVKEFADKKGIDYPDWKGHYANYEFDQLLQPAIAPDNAIGQNANDQNFWNFLQQQN